MPFRKLWSSEKQFEIAGATTADTKTTIKNKNPVCHSQWHASDKHLKSWIVHMSQKHMDSVQFVL